MSYYCEMCYRFVKPTRKYKQFKSIFQKEFDKCKHINLTVENLDINNRYKQSIL